MHVWHLELDTPRRPHRVSPGDFVTLGVGTWPIAPGQSVWVTGTTRSLSGRETPFLRKARWSRNDASNSYWEVDLGRFERGDRVRYRVLGESEGGRTEGSAECAFSVGPKLRLALLWHHHQPIYRELGRPGRAGSCRQPWVRLHALRDYYGMARLIAAHPGLRATINLTPALLQQLDDLVAGATDRAFELSRKPAEKLTSAERAEIVDRFFDAHWHNQIFVHRRYKELFDRRAAEQSMSDQELRDLQMWFNLAWFGVELREGEVELVTGETASVARFVEQGRGFSVDDVEGMLDEQRKVLRAVVPLHRRLADEGRIEISTSPYFHPILPLLVDSDAATLDQPGSWLPRRFAHPEDAERQIELAVADYQRRFGRAPAGMWPAEGAVSQASLAPIARHGLRWVATDAGVLARSGAHGYHAEEPDVLCRPYRVDAAGRSLSVFFRDTQLSDAIGFAYQHFPNGEEAAYDFVGRVKERFARRVSGSDERVLSVILEGETPWGAYERDGRPFLEALYRLLEDDPEIETTTFGAVLDGDVDRQQAPSPLTAQERLHELFTGSWADTPASAAGIDLGSWIGTSEENGAWNELGRARDALALAGKTPESCPAAFEAIYVAEGSDWFAWYGSNQESGRDDELDALFRSHLAAAYQRAGLSPPPDLSSAIGPTIVPWSFTQKVPRVAAGSRLAVRTNCPGTVEWQLDHGPMHREPVVPSGGVMLGVQRHQLVLGPFIDETPSELEFRFRCGSVHCARESVACGGSEQHVGIGRGQPGG